MKTDRTTQLRTWKKTLEKEGLNFYVEYRRRLSHQDMLALEEDTDYLRQLYLNSPDSEEQAPVKTETNNKK